MKVVELTTNDLLPAEIEAVALVQEPAIEEDFYAFNGKQYYFETYNDYPQAARNAAEQGIKRNEELGNRCATQVGKVRAQQIARGEKLSLDTIRRMRSFLIRHKDSYELAKSRKDYEACGYISYLLWGGPSALPWAEKKLRQAGERIDSAMVLQEVDKEYSFTEIEDMVFKHIFAEQMGLEVGELPDYESAQRRLVGPVMIPNRLIKRYDKDSDEEYWVYFSEETIKELAEKFMKNGMIHSSNIEHDGIPVDGVSMVETWLIEDNTNDKSNLYGKKYPKGTWMAAYSIDNKDIWKKVQSKEIKGFSVEGWFGEKFFNYMKFNDADMIDGIVDILLQVEDMNNRREMAENVMADFEEEGIVYDKEAFLTRVGLDIKNQILKFAAQSGYSSDQMQKFANARAGGGDRDIEKVIPNWAKDPRVTTTLYKYAGSISSNSRDFCTQMINLDRYYTKDDIDAMSSISVNAGFGRGGSSTYDIFKYLGGVNCKHYWRQFKYTFNNGKFELLSESRAGGLAGTPMNDRSNGGRV